MESRSVETIIRTLNDANVRYLIVGGLAVVAHGYLRFTADLDLIVDLRPDNLMRALPVLAGLGFRPQVPVPLEQFADPVLRKQWVQNKQLTVFSLFSPEHAATTLDLFVEEPLDFDKAYAKAYRQEVGPGTWATFVSFEDLVSLKKQAGRPKDLEDVQQLQSLRKPFKDE